MRDFHALWWFIEFWIYLILRVLVRITDRLGGNFLAFLLLQDLAWETSVGTQLRVHLKWNNWKWFALKMLELYLRIKDLGHFRRFRGFLPWFGPTSSAHFSIGLFCLPCLSLSILPPRSDRPARESRLLSSWRGAAGRLTRPLGADLSQMLDLFRVRSLVRTSVCVHLK